MKRIEWNTYAKKDISELPEAVRCEFGHELYLLQLGETPENASPFEGSKGGDLMKLVERFDGDTYRCVYVAKLKTAIYVLHVYMKKSAEGSRTPQRVVETVHRRYKLAQEADIAALSKITEQNLEKKGEGI